jgi:hypothetical protein
MPPLPEHKRRFWTSVNKHGPIHPVLGTRCWLWTAGKFRRGYGRVDFCGKSTGSHRYSWRIHFGNIPNGLCVLHRCDNPPCVNPDHLFLGTRTDNMTDRDHKGRQSKGEHRPLAKLTDELVREIRRRYRKRCRRNGIHAISRELGVAPLTIWKVVNNITWKHI